MAKVDATCTRGCTMQHAAPDVGVFGGIVIGITAALLWQRYYRIKLVPWLAFFGGRRFVPILMALAGLAWGVFFGLLWPPIGDGLNNFASWLYDNGRNLFRHLQRGHSRPHPDRPAPRPELVRVVPGRHLLRTPRAPSSTAT